VRQGGKRKTFGIKSRGFKGPRPSPVQEVPVIHFHRTLAEYMGAGKPKDILAKS